MPDSRPVLVTTSHRGVFFGYMDTLALPVDGQVTLTQARMCVYWPTCTRGVLGLAAMGPPKGSRVGPAAPRLILAGVVAVCEVTAEAVRRWEEGPWQT